MISPRLLVLSLAKRIIPWTWRKRLNKYRGSGFLMRCRLGWNAQPVVLSGPFAGLLYPKFSTGSEYFPKLLGTYEMELHDTIEELCRQQFTSIVIVGGGEGYYVGGLARRISNVPVICFEGDQYGRHAIAEMSHRNGFAARIENRGFCRLEDLEESLADSEHPLLVMDVEGGERELLDLDRIVTLRVSTILVEVHDCFEPGLDSLLLERFSETHRSKEILSRPRTLADARSLPLADSLTNDLLLLLDEKRPAQMRWFLFTPIFPAI